MVPITVYGKSIYVCVCVCVCVCVRACTCVRGVIGEGLVVPSLFYRNFTPSHTTIGGWRLVLQMDLKRNRHIPFVHQLLTFQNSSYTTRLLFANLVCMHVLCSNLKRDS